MSNNTLYSVFITTRDFDGNFIEGIYSSHEKAEEAVEKLIDEEIAYEENIEIESHNVKESEVLYATFVMTGDFSGNYTEGLFTTYKEANERKEKLLDEDICCDEIQIRRYNINKSECF